MAYLPLARKYRPQTFEELLGQPHVTTTLTQAIATGRIAQAYLFAGQRGVGKTSAARILAKCLNCEKGPTPKPCSRCDQCRPIMEGNSLDVTEIDGASNRGIDEIRRLRETIPFAPVTGAFHIYIIDEVHMLTPEAFNALLKTLEEPPQHVKFVFATTAPNKLPATILSRCQRFDFRRIDAPAMVGLLKRLAQEEKLTVDEAALYAIARASDGSLRDAEVILEQLSNFAQGSISEEAVTELLGALDPQSVFEWMQAILEGNTSQALAYLMKQLDLGRDVPQLLGGLTRHVRNLLVARSTAEAPSREELLNRLIDEPAERILRLDQQAGNLSAQELLFLLQILTSAYEMVRRSPMARTVLELVIVKLATRESWQSLEQISRRLEQLSQRSSAQSIPDARTVAVEPKTAVAGTSPDSVKDRRESQSQPSLDSMHSVQPRQRSSQSSAVAAPADLDPTPVTSPTPTAAPSVSVNTLMNLWPTFLERLGSQKMSLAAYLANARPIQREADVLTVGLPGFVLHQEVLSQVDHCRLIERLLSDVYQTPLTIQYTTLPDELEPAPSEESSNLASSASAVVQDIVKFFNATLIEPPAQPNA